MRSFKNYLFITLFIALLSCTSYNKSIEGFYKYSCVLMDNIEIFSNNRYRYYTQGVLNEGTWYLKGDTLILLDDWQRENLLKKEELLFDRSDSLFLGRTIFNQLNDMFLKSIKPKMFLKKHNKFIEIYDSKNQDKNCFLRRIQK